jgi:hypothetical protein
MNTEEIVEFLRSEIEPVSDTFSRQAYRASAYLKDGVYLPCVKFRDVSEIVDLAIRRLDETRKNKSLHKSIGYRATIKSWIAEGNRVNAHDILSVEKSPFAIPANCRNAVWSAGETRMSWISFVGLMNDGKEFWFGTPFNIEFFDMPEGYSADQMTEVIPHKSLSGPCFKDRPYFDCYVEH